MTYAVGGVGAPDFQAWKAAGVSGFGVGSNLYKPGMSVAEIASNAATLVAAYDAT
jgi:2-dehydro-3-deoxyphosphogalactonate aldolase